MEVIATAAETRELTSAHLDAAMLLFGEDRSHPIRMDRDLPYRWIERGAFRRFEGTADRGEFYAFQVGVYAIEDLRDLRVTISDLRSDRGDVIPTSAVSAFNFRGIDSKGRAFTVPVSAAAGSVRALWFGVAVPTDATTGSYRGAITLSAAGHTAQSLPVTVTVTPQNIAAHGDNEPARLSRLRWLDSRIGLDDQIVRPFTPVQVQDRRVRVIGREVRLGNDGLPEQITSYFAPDVTRLSNTGRELLARPVRLTVEDAVRGRIRWRSGPLQFVERRPGHGDGLQHRTDRARRRL